jgi:hypothetical protein
MLRGLRESAGSLRSLASSGSQESVHKSFACATRRLFTLWRGTPQDTTRRGHEPLSFASCFTLPFFGRRERSAAGVPL